MGKQLDGASRIKEDKLLGENLLKVISEYTRYPLFQIEEVCKITRSYDKTLMVLAVADKYKLDPTVLAHDFNRIATQGE